MAVSKIIKQKSEWTTVWTNPDPSESFQSGQTVDIDLTQYTELCFILKSTTTGMAQYYNYLPIPSTSAMLLCVSERIWLRYGVEITSSTIGFGAGAIVNNYGTRTDSAANAIPIKVLAR